VVFIKNLSFTVAGAASVYPCSHIFQVSEKSRLSDHNEAILTYIIMNSYRK
jgi:hypothetical protein